MKFRFAILLFFSLLRKPGRALGSFALIMSCFLAATAQAEDEPKKTPEEDKGPKENEPFYSDYLIAGITRFLWMETDNEALVVDQYKLVVDDRLQTPENIYLAVSLYSATLTDNGKKAEALYYCQKYPPHADHFEYLTSCVLAKGLPIRETMTQIEAYAEQAQKAFPHRLIAANLFKLIGSISGSQGHAHEAIRLLKRAYEVFPPDAEQDLAELKSDLAAAYANPLLSEAMQRLSPQYYTEVRDFYKTQVSSRYIENQIKGISYNKAIGHLFMFREYAIALEELEMAEGHSYLSTDIKVFKAYAYAKSKQLKLARETLKAIDWSINKDPDRDAFLHCYVDLTRRLLGETVSVQTCLNLKNPQTDVLLDLTSTLAELNLEAKEENLMWRNFYKFFSEHLKPDFQESMASASSETELQAQKADSRMKDLKLKNLSLYQDLSYALFGIAVFCALAFFLAIRSWRKGRRHTLEMSAGKARLQYIIDNIEEGLVLIRPGLHLEPEESRHLLAITGGHDLKQATLKSLLALTDLSDDSQSIAEQCMGACLGEGNLAWELNQPNLPTEARIQDRDIAFYWQAIFVADEIKSVLLVMRNITEINEMERVSKKAREEADLKLEYAREILACHPRAVAAFLNDLPRLLQLLAFSSLQTHDFSAAKRIAHNIKGTARTLGLLDLQNQAHWLEDEMSSEDAEQLPTMIKDLENLGQTYLSAMQHVLGESSDMDVRSLFDLVAHHKPALERQLAAADMTLGNLMVDESTTLTRQELQPLAEVLLHALTNAADHGFILPKRQGRILPDPRFAVSVFHRGEHRVLILRDNGAGINHEKIHQQAKERGWEPGEGQLWSDFLFLEGVTTAETLTITSGRGVGMSAIRNAAARLNGRVQLLDNDNGVGSMLKIVWPIAQELAA